MNHQAELEKARTELNDTRIDVLENYINNLEDERITHRQFARMKKLAARFQEIINDTEPYNEYLKPV